MPMRDRVKEFRRVPAAELLDNDRNWRVHPHAQKAALSELLDSVGIAGALIAYESPRNGGALTLIDGHERRGSYEADWPVLVLDVDDAEADLLLATLDPIAAMARPDKDALNDLLAELMPVSTVGLNDLLERLKTEEPEEPARQDPLPVTEEYVVAVFGPAADWKRVQKLVKKEPQLELVTVPVSAVDLVKEAAVRMRLDEGDVTLPVWKVVELAVADWLAGAGAGEAEAAAEVAAS
jgi:hypothetical protein